MTSNNGLFNSSDQTSRKVRLVKPYPITHQFRPDQEFVGKTLLEMMSAKFPFNPKEEWNRRIELGLVFVDKGEVAPDFVLQEHHSVFHHNPKVVEPSVPDEVKVIEEKEEYLAVFKPAPMPMHPGGRYNKNTLMEILKEMGFEDLRITHRLDAVTSGLVLFAKTKEFAKRVTEEFTAGNVKKEYLALVWGRPIRNKKKIESRIRRKHGFVFESGDLDSGQLGITKFRVLRRYRDSSLIRCKPITGRTHQIRLHLAEWGYPIIDDPIYGPNGDVSSKKTQNVGISLVSSKLKIDALNIELEIGDYEFLN